MLRDLVARPPYQERSSPDEWRQLAVVRLLLAATAIAIDVGLVLALRGRDAIDVATLDRFAAINLPLITVSGLLSLGMWRSDAFRREWILGASAVLEAGTVIVWSQATGSLTSYFILAGALLLFFYRMYTSWAVAAAIALSLIVFHGGAIALEIAGVLDPVPLFTGPPSAVYTEPTYQALAASSVAWIYALTFVSSNALINKLRAKDRALANLRREAQLAARGLGPGRLTGLVVGGEYALHELLGRGGMGEVYLARRVGHGDDVALKILHAHLSVEGELLERFQREASLAARIPGRHVPEVLDIGRDPERDLHYIAMELLHGEDFAAYLRRVGRPTVAELLPLARRIAAAVDAAHAAGVVHRDIKPQNIFLCDSDERVVLLDFGLSKAIGAEGSLTGTDALLGTASYMAPEQAMGAAEAGPPADLFSFAAVLYRALTGKPPHDAADVVSAIKQALHSRPTQPSLLEPGLPRQVDAVMALGLAREPQQRFATAVALVDALDAAGRGELDGDVVERARSLDPNFVADPTLPALSGRPH